MPVATPDTYTAAAGATIYAGRTAAVTFPAWRVGAPLNTFTLLAGTSGGGGVPAVDTFSNIAKIGQKWVIGASEGHGGGYNNAVVCVDFSVATPAWATLKAASASGTPDAAYGPDGAPGARHCYFSIFGISGNRMLLPGMRNAYPTGGGLLDTVDAFNLTTNQWVGVVAGSPGTSGSGLASLSPSGSVGTVQDANGDIWSINPNTGAVAKYSVAGNSWSQPAMAATITTNIRYPWALDTLRGVMFGMSFSDGESVGSDLRTIVLTGATQYAITLSGSGLASLLAAPAQYANMCYDAPNDRFLFICGGTNIWAIAPTSGTNWTVTLLSTVLPVGPYVIPKWHYFPEFGGVMYLASRASNIYFMRTL